MVIRQGDVYWINLLEEPIGSEPGYRRPFLVVQNNLFNRSQISTVLVCPLTSKLKWAESPGNVLLDAGEANLPKQSVVNVSQIATVNKWQLAEQIGHLSLRRIRQVLAGIYLVIDPHDVA
jgi:mRNA interferase MazF